MTPEQERVWKFAIAEFNAIHAICDAAEIPRVTNDGEKFSTSQRVRILATVMEGTRAAIATMQGAKRTSH